MTESQFDVNQKLNEFICDWKCGTYAVRKEYWLNCLYVFAIYLK